MLLCSLSNRPAEESVRVRACVSVCVCECVRARRDTAEGSGIIECSLVPGEVEVVTVQSLQT